MSSAPQSSPAPRLRFAFLALFGLGGLAGAYASSSVSAMATPVYQMTLGINPAWLGIALAIPRVLDAFTDPIMGNISDNFRSRFGRRRPFIAVGAILMGLSYGLIWMVPAGWGHAEQLAWFVVTSILFFTCSTVFSIPLQSLSYELTPDYDERTRVMGFSSFWNCVGGLTYQWVFPLSQLAFFASPMLGVRTVGWGVAIFCLTLPGLIPALISHERFAEQAAHQPKVRFWNTVRETFRSRCFMMLFAIYMITLLVGFTASSMDYYLLVYFVSGGDLAAGAFWKGVLSSGYGAVGFLAIPVLTWASARWGKISTLIGVLAICAVGYLCKWWIFTPGIGWWLLIDPLLGGGALWVAMSMVVQSMFADVCDEDELLNGQRREGMFGAVFSWLTKMGISVGFLLTGVALNWVGFDAARKGNQSPDAILAMRLYLSVVPAVAAVVCIVLLRRYPITRDKAAETRCLLEARRGAI